MDEASLCDRIALIHQGSLMSVATPKEMTGSFPEDLWAVRTRKIYDTSKFLEKLPSVISVNSFGQVLHLVTKKGSNSAQLIQQFLSEKGELEISVTPMEATIEDVFILLMNHHKHRQ